LRGDIEQKIRKYLVNNNFIKDIIQLLYNLFYGTSIAICIMVPKKKLINLSNESQPILNTHVVLLFNK